MVIEPLARASGMMSFIRLIERMKVDLPHPDGPISAVTLRAGISSEMPCKTLSGP